MKKITFVAGLLGFLAAGLTVGANAQVNIGVAVGNNGLDSFHLAIGDYFKVSDQQVQACEDYNISDEDQPVVFFIAQRAAVSPEAVILLRSHGWSWMQIALHFRLNPRIFYTPGTYVGTPYERGYHSFQGRGRINLSDGDIVNFVNLKFMSEHYGHDPGEIARLRAQGKSFRDINDGYVQKHEEVQWDAKEEPHRFNHHQDQGNHGDQHDQRDQRDGHDR